MLRHSPLSGCPHVTAQAPENGCNSDLERSRHPQDPSARVHYPSTQDLSDPQDGTN